MDNTETKLTEKEALHIGGAISRLLLKAEKLYGDKYDRFSIQIEAGEGIFDRTRGNIFRSRLGAYTM